MNHDLGGRFPKVGIRPAIDGRLGGVRESLEETTMGMARSVARLIASRLRHYNGQAVDCVIAERCIGGVAEAAACASQFAREGVGVSLTVTPCWCYGSETMDMDPLMPKAIWGFNGTERPGAVYLAATMAAHNQKGLPAFGIYGRDVQDTGDTEIPADVEEMLLRFVRAGLAVAQMRGKSYLSMGGCSMGIAGSIVDPNFLEAYLGMRSETIDMTEFSRRIEREIYDRDEFAHAMNWVRARCREGEDHNGPAHKLSREQNDRAWEISVKMTLIARDLMLGNPKLAQLGYGEESLGHHALAAGFQGQRQWTDHLPNGDFMEAMLNTSYDWNGLRRPLILATENDYLNGMTMLFNHLLTGCAQIFADVRTYWSPEAVRRVTGHTLTGESSGGFIHLINSGAATLDGAGRATRNGQPAMKPFWEMTEAEGEANLAATTWYPGMTEYFRGGGYSSQYMSPGGMPVTMARINLIKGLGPALQIAEGVTIDLPAEVAAAIDRRTNPTWPTHWFVPRTTGKGVFRDAYSVMNAWGSNHGAIGYGHIGADLITLAAMVRIPVYMHNVADEQIFRPGAWTAFGAQDPMGADLRACENFGPLYAKY